MIAPSVARRRGWFVWVTVLSVVIAALVLAGCSGPEAPESKPAIPDGEHDPAVWGEIYPAEYQRWLATSEERPAGRSPYKRGFDGGKVFDKLSEFPFMPLLFKGWGFGIEYNEPRGHYYMLTDQQIVDPARVKAGGACLTCKSPYTQDLYEEDKDKLFGATYKQAVAMLPKEHQQLGVSCIDCHDNETMELETRRWTIDSAMTEIGLKKDELTNQQKKLLVCGQCHCTYSVMKEGTQSVDVDFPWEGGEWGSITIEDIITNLETQKPRLEWVQAVTGFKLGFIRHPEFEFYSAGSPHFMAGATCNDCHMERTQNGEGPADHNQISPLKRDMAACKGCHVEGAEEMRAKVIEIQDRYLGQFVSAGYRVATVAKLFEMANASLETTSGDAAYDAARKHYKQAFYRVLYMGAENSLGFHNPAESDRILSDAVKEGVEAEALLRKLLASKGVQVPAEVPLDLRVYTDDRGVKKLDFAPDDYIPDPTGAAQKKWPQSLSALAK